MKLRRPLVLVLALAALAARARAQDQNAAAAAQAVGGMVPGAATGGAVGPAGAGGQPAAGKPSAGGHFQRALGGAPAFHKSRGGAKSSGGKKAASGKKKKKHAESKYMSRELVEGSEHSYHFDENGDPVRATPSRKAGAKSKKKASSPTEEKDDPSGACTSEEPCTVKNRDADAL